MTCSNCYESKRLLSLVVFFLPLELGFFYFELQMRVTDAQWTPGQVFLGPLLPTSNLQGCVLVPDSSLIAALPGEDFAANRQKTR